jgi:hypothetical protein
MALAHQWALIGVPIVDTHTAIRKAQMADFDGAIELCRATLDNLVASGDGCWRALATTTLVESLLRRGADADVAEAQAAIDRLAAVPTDPAYVMHEVPLLRMRALLARAHGDEDGYWEFANRYRTKATDLGFEGHIATAEAMLQRRQRCAGRAGSHYGRAQSSATSAARQSPCRTGTVRPSRSRRPRESTSRRIVVIDATGPNTFPDHRSAARRRDRPRTLSPGKPLRYPSPAKCLPTRVIEP